VIHTIAEVTVVPVLSAKMQIVMARRGWPRTSGPTNVPQRVGFFVTTV
jgi:hypothetical protein